MLAYIPAGALVDRWDQWWVMFLTEAGRAMALVTVFLALTFGGTAKLAILLPAMIVEEVLEVFYVLADKSYLIRLAAHNKVSDGQASIEARTHAVILAGRPISPLLFQIGQAWPFLADAISFCFSMAGLCWLKFSRQVLPRVSHPTEASLRTDIQDGLRWLRGDRRAALTTLLMACTTLVAQALIMIFLTLACERKLPSATLGVVLAASGAGGGLGALFAKRATRRGRVHRFLGPAKDYWLQMQLAAWSLVIMLLAFTGGQAPWMALSMTVFSFSGAISNIRFGTYLAQRVPSDMQARVTGIGQFLFIGANAIGPLLGGVLVEGQVPAAAVLRLFALAMFLTLISFGDPIVWRRSLKCLSRLGVARSGARPARGYGASVAIENIDGVGAVQHRQGDVADQGAAGGGTALSSGMGMAVDVQPRARAVGRLGQEVAAQEWVDLWWLAQQCPRDRRVMGQRDQGVRVQPAQRPAQRVAQLPGVPHECLHLRLAELGRPEAREAAAEALAATDSEPPPWQVKHDAAAFKHRDARRDQQAGYLVFLIALIVVIAQHPYYRDAQVRELRRDDLRLVQGAVLGEVTGQQ
jgi:hypothetical protein